MLHLPAPFAQHLASRTLTLAICWTITKSNGEVLRGTSHDADVTITSGPYAGTYPRQHAVLTSDIETGADGAVPNADADGFIHLADALLGPENGFTVEDFEGGLLDQAPAALFLVNWTRPDDGQKELLVGTLGELGRDSEGRLRAEARGVEQALTQQILGSFAERCDVKRFGDHRCKFDVASRVRTGTVDAVVHRRHFTAELAAGPAPVTKMYYFGGVLRWTSGANAARESIVLMHNALTLDADAQVIEVGLQDEAAADIEAGDTFELEPGCDRLPHTCRFAHDNFLNIRAYGLYASGKDRLMAGPRGGTDAPYSASLTLEKYLDAIETMFENLGPFPGSSE